jgi:inner membrane protein
MSPSHIWLVVGLILIVLEFATPGVILIFIGLGAWVTALALMSGLVTSVGAQFSLFGISSVLLLVTLRRILKPWFIGHKHQGKDTELEGFLGKRVQVVQPILNNRMGKVEFNGVAWNARCDEVLQSGDAAEILGRDDLCLVVKKI